MPESTSAIVPSGEMVSFIEHCKWVYQWTLCPFETAVLMGRPDGELKQMHLSQGEEEARFGIRLSVTRTYLESVKRNQANPHRLLEA